MNNKQRWLGPLFHIAVSSLWVFWLGGLTFYMAIVVPVAGEVIGGFEQGKVSAVVTRYLNLFGIIAFLALLVESHFRKDRWQLLLAMGLILPQLLLFPLHHELSKMMLGQPSLWFVDWKFYSVHRIYLWITTFQWIIGFSLHVRRVILSRSTYGDH